MATQEEINKKWELAQRTSLWKRTLGSSDKNVEPLRESFLDARKNAIYLLDKIREDFPNLTVHDITHVDSLWNVADTIIGEEYPINPLEGYVLGIAFLIHDAALSYEAVGGKDKLRDTVEWKDAYAEGPGDKDEEEFKKECDFAAIRALHAKYAEDILNKKFERDNTTTFYIIDNDEYRTQFGDMIGKIAASHHWSIDEVESILENQVNPVAGLPSDWEINEQKLACILRCADAGHIDNGRAPYGIYNSLIVNGVSRDHWESQTRLGQVRENRKNPEQLLITSTRPFDKDNFAAWNVAYDAVKLFDEELKKSNELLKPAGLSFPHRNVTGSESKEALSEYIKTKGWLPCSFGVHTSNVKALIENLGGSKLYGESNLLLVALRELIQNARDAIQARRTMEDRPEEGRITIRLKEEEGKRWFEVEDDGIGMSLDCIKHNLLDFGSSYWKSNLAKYELPGLRSKGFKSIGKFGIGFYSVFMVAKSVEVITRRYNKGADDAWRIEFPSGLTLSPIMSKTEVCPSLSTIVKFELKDEVNMVFFLLGYRRYEVSLTQVLSALVVGLDADVCFEKKGIIHQIHSNVKSSYFDKKEWLKSLFIDEPENIDELASNMEKLTDERGHLRGWLLPPEWIYKITYPKYTSKEFATELIPCMSTIGGLWASLKITEKYYRNNGYIGYLDGIEDSISRNKMILDDPLKKCLQKWANQKYEERYDDIVHSKTLHHDYLKLIKLCGLQEIIINDNLKRFYTNYCANIEIGTIIGLSKIRWCLFAGIADDADSIFSRLINKNDVKDIFGLVENNYPKIENLDWIYTKFELEDASYIIDLVRINELPISNYSEIMHKYWKLLVFQRLDDEIMTSLGVWVNLILDKKLHQMIDWRKVSIKHLRDLISNDMFIETSSYLEHFLSSTYLSEMTAQTNEIR